MTLRVLGIDPGTHRTGWGVVASAGTKMSHVANGVIHAQGELALRLHQLAAELERVIQAQQPDVIAVESLFHHKNSRSALQLGHARGVILLCVARSDRPLFEYSPAEIKRAATGNGRADKELVARMVKMLLGYRGELRPDASDALATAICHANSSGKLPT